MNQAGDKCGYVGLHKVQQILGVTRLTPVARQSEGEVITVADPGFPRRKRGVIPNGAVTHCSANFSQNLHENKKNWVPAHILTTLI